MQPAFFAKKIGSSLFKFREIFDRPQGPLGAVNLLVNESLCRFLDCLAGGLDILTRSLHGVAAEVHTSQRNKHQDD